jgi:hypothetical protein
MNALVFFGRKNMGADRQVVIVAIDELEGKHAALSIQRSDRMALKTLLKTFLLKTFYDTRWPSISTTEHRYTTSPGGFPVTSVVRNSPTAKLDYCLPKRNRRRK